MKATFLFALTLAVAVAVPEVGPGHAAEDPRQLKWADLIPRGAAKPTPNKTFFSGVPTKSDDGAAAPPPLPEGKFMSMKRQQPGGGAPPQVVTELDGKRVKIGGYVVPLDFEATRIKEFLLVPFVGACIHVPPPPANQIVYVKAEGGLDISGSFDPVMVTGTIKTETAFTGLADAGYSIAAEAVDLITP